MSKSTIRISLALIFVFSLAAARAQQFRQPTPEELHMTTDPMAPGADAVYLNLEETTDDQLHFHSYYARIKVLTEKGKNLATVQLPYWHDDFKITDIKARTIHADGTIVPLEGKPDDLISTKTTQFQLNSKVFNLPSVEVGSILEYTYKVRYDDHRFSAPRWEIQQHYFIHEAHYVFNPYGAFIDNRPHQAFSYLIDQHGRPVNSLVWWHILPAGQDVRIDEKGRFRVDLTNVPAAPDEEWMPPMESTLYKVEFYYISATSSQQYWITESKFWSKDVDHFAEPDKTLREAVGQIVTASDSETEKARKLYNAVQALENTDFTRSKSASELKQLHIKEQKHASDTWNQKSGNSNDLAMLYLAMLRAANLQAYAMVVVNRNRGTFMPDYLSFSQFDDFIVVANLDGKEYLLDPGEKMCPFETVHWHHSGAGGVRQAPGGHEGIWVTPNPSYSMNTTVRTGDLTLNADGSITGILRINLAGQPALYWRQQSLRVDEDELKREFDRMMKDQLPEGVEDHVSGFLGLDDPNSNLMVVVKVSGNLGTTTGKRLLVPGSFFEARGSHPFVSAEKREVPVDMHYAEEITDQVTYHYPQGYHLEAAPQDSKLPWPNRAVLIVKSNSDTDSTTITRQFVRGFSTLPPSSNAPRLIERAVIDKEYSALHDFYVKVAASDQQQLVLTSAPLPAR